MRGLLLDEALDDSASHGGADAGLIERLPSIREMTSQAHRLGMGDVLGDILDSISSTASDAGASITDTASESTVSGGSLFDSITETLAASSPSSPAPAPSPSSSSSAPSNPSSLTPAGAAGQAAGQAAGGVFSGVGGAIGSILQGIASGAATIPGIADTFGQNKGAAAQRQLQQEALQVQALESAQSAASWKSLIPWIGGAALLGTAGLVAWKVWG